MTIGENIKRIRKEKGMTQKELGEKLGKLSQQQIGQWETGKANPKIETLKKIAEALDVPLLELFTKTENGEEIIDLNIPGINSDEQFEEYTILLRTLIPYIEDKIEKENFKEFLKNYNKLNKAGKAEAQKRIAELTEIPRYTVEQVIDTVSNAVKDGHINIVKKEE